MKPISFDHRMSTPMSKLAMHQDSHTISKVKPKIRIIHIVAPEIIKTDVENFRALVQRLTGMPVSKGHGSSKKEKCGASKESRSGVGVNCSKNKIKKSMVMTQDGNHPMLMQQQQHHQKFMKEEPQNFFEGESPNGLLFQGGLGMDGGFIQDLSEFPIFPFKSSQFSMFGEMPLC